MNSSSMRVAGEAEQTSRFRREQLDSLVARSRMASAVFEASLDGVSLEATTAEYPAATPPWPSSSEPPPSPSSSARKRRWVKRQPG